MEHLTRMQRTMLNVYGIGLAIALAFLCIFGIVTKLCENIPTEVKEPVAIAGVTIVETNLDEYIRQRYSYVARVVAGECQTEPYEGKVMLCSAIYNSAQVNGLTAEQQLKESGWKYAKPIAEEDVSDEVWEAVKEVFYFGHVANPNVQIWYSTAGGFKSTWHEQQTFVCEIGYHRFFKIGD